MLFPVDTLVSLDNQTEKQVNTKKHAEKNIYIYIFFVKREAEP